MTKLLYDTKGAAEVLSVSTGFLEALRIEGGGPAYLKIVGRGRGGYAVRYTPDALEAWVEAQKAFANTTQAAMRSKVA